MRSSLLFAAALGLAVSASAQTQFYIKGGLNVATFSGEDVDFAETDGLRSEPRLGAVGGAGVLVPLSPSVGIQVEGLYSQKGIVFEDEFAPGDYQETTRLDYLEVPAMVRLAVPVGRTLDAGLSVGGYLGVPLRSEVAVDDLGDEFTNDLETSTDYGGLIGVDLGSGNAYVEARYSFGLTDAVDYDAGLDLVPDYRNQVVSLTLGFKFGGDRYGGYGRY